MVKDLVVRLNEIGQEIGYPYQILKNGEYRPYVDDGSEVAIVVYEALPEWCMLSDLQDVTDAKRLEWKKLFPYYLEDRRVDLTLQEEMKLIMYGKTETVLNYYRGKRIYERIAKAMVARNDEELLLGMRLDDYSLPSVLASAIVLFMNDTRFEKFISKASQVGILHFSTGVEEKIVSDASDRKYCSYVKHYGLRASSQSLIVRMKLFDRLKDFVAIKGRLKQEIELALEYQKEHRLMGVAYKNALEEFEVK